MFVIAQGSTFALRDRGIGPEEAGPHAQRRLRGQRLGAPQWQRLTVSADLIETRTARIIWAEVFDEKIEDALDVLDEIGNRIVASVAHEIEMVERNRAILKPPNSLDAWEAHHRGLWHMYRFNRTDNERARQFFAQAVELDPTFARAYAGPVVRAFSECLPRLEEAASRRSTAPSTPPARASWSTTAIRRRTGPWAARFGCVASQDQSIIELERAVDLSPNYATAHYTLAFVHSQSGDPHAAISFSDHSRHLSPFDPLLFAMLGIAAIGLARLGQYEEAAEWAIKAAARPNAHQHIMAIAACTLGLAGRVEDANTYKARIRERVPDYAMADFLAAFRFSPDAAAVFKQGGQRIGIV